MKFSGRPNNYPLQSRAALILIAVLSLTQNSFADDSAAKPAIAKSFMVISTGARNSDEYLLGSSICQLVNLRSKDTNIYCSITSSSGAIMNVDRARRGNADFIILKSSKIIQAIKGSPAFANPRPFKDLRAVMTGYTQDLTVLASTKLNIDGFKDLQGKTINVDTDPDGAASLLELVNGESKDAFIVDKQNTDFAKQSEILCSDGGATIAIETAHKNVELSRLAERCNLKLIGLDQSLTKQLVAKNSYLSETVIAANTYRNQPSDLQTVGEGVTVVTNKSTDPKLVNNLVSSVIGQLTRFKNSMPFLKNANVLDLKPKSDFILMYPGIEGNFEQ